MNLVTLTLVLMTVAHDGTDMLVHHRDRGCGLRERLVEEGDEGCDHVRMVTKVDVCGVLAPPSWRCEGSGVEIDLGVHYHNSHAYNQKKIIKAV